MSTPIRLQKILAEAGFGSRRSCETFILEGRVSVDGTVVRELGVKADPENQSILLDGQRISGPGRTAKSVKNQKLKVYYILHKPKGVLCTNDDPAGRPLAIQLIPEKRRIFCVGRLDKESEGLILLTNDGDLTQQLTHPKYGVSKVYIAKVDGMVSIPQIEKLKAGVYLAEGRTKSSFVRVRKKKRKTSVLEITISEGMNRQVRRILAAVGLKCRSLKRIQIGPIKLGAMPEGAYRHLSSEEFKRLHQHIERAQKTAEAHPPARTARPHGTSKTKQKDQRIESDSRHRPWEKPYAKGPKAKKKSALKSESHSAGKKHLKKGGQPDKSSKGGKERKTNKSGKVSKPRKPVSK